jgi:hypothetical protein
MPSSAVQRETRERFGWILEDWRKGGAAQSRDEHPN